VKALMQAVDGRPGRTLAEERRRVQGLFLPQKGRPEDEVRS